MVEPCPLIEIAGTPVDRGEQYGRAAADRIRKGMAHYGAQLVAMGLDEVGLARVVKRYLPSIEAFAPTYVEEMRGIARGADVPFDQIVLLNARTEVLELAKHPERQNMLDVPDEPDGCTVAVGLPAATRDGTLIHAHNWDWKSECAETSVILRIRRDDGPDILTFTEAGALARFGFNGHGIAITGNYLESDRDYRQMGVPLALIRRKVLEQERLALALHTVYTAPKSASNNITVTHRAGLCFNVECAPDETFPVEPKDGLLVHSNHWLSPVAQARLRDTGIAAMPCTLYRNVRVHGLLAPKLGDLTVADFKAALGDAFESPWSVCRPPRPSTRNNLTATVATIIMCPAAGVMEVALLPALGARYDSYRLAMTPLTDPKEG